MCFPPCNDFAGFPPCNDFAGLPPCDVFCWASDVQCFCCGFRRAMFLCGDFRRSMFPCWVSAVQFSLCWASDVQSFLVGLLPCNVVSLLWLPPCNISLSVFRRAIFFAVAPTVQFCLLRISTQICLMPLPCTLLLVYPADSLLRPARYCSLAVC